MSENSLALRLALVVEADPVAQRHLASLLSNLGYEPVVTGSVAESLAALAHNQFLLSLVDLDLDGADGAEFLRRLKVDGGSPGPVIVIARGDSIKRLPEAARVPKLNRAITRKAALPDEQIAAAAKVLGVRPRGRWEGEGLYVLRLSRTKLLFIFDTDATPACRIINSNSRLRISRTRSTPHMRSTGKAPSRRL